jgi:arylsulfatase A-like enzyme
MIQDRSLLRAVLGGALAVALGLMGCAEEPTHPVPGTIAAEPSSGGAPYERIVLIVVDTLRRDALGCYGAPTPTPHIDALAKRGQTFTNAFSSFHQTTMSMAALFTGHTPSLDRGAGRQNVGWSAETWGGLVRFAPPHGSAAGTSIPATIETLAEALRGAGYWTIGVATNLLLHRPGGYEQGFEVWRELGGKPPVYHPAVTRAVVEALRARPRDRLFLYVHYMDVHDPSAPTYPQRVQEADAGVGDLLAALEREGLLEGAVVVFTSDHGERLGEPHFVPGLGAHFGNPSFEEVLQVPLVVAPAVFDDTTRLVRTDDVHRMLRQLAGVAPGPVPELEAGELFVSERYYQTYRKGRWKSYRDRTTGVLALVDLEHDAAEARNVAAMHPEVAARHAERLDALERHLGAPDAPEAALAPEDVMRLRALGYVP